MFFVPPPLLQTPSPKSAMGVDDLDQASSTPPPPKSVHQALGGGAVADVLLWKQWKMGVFVLVGATMKWVLFEKAGYSLLSFVANVLLLLVTILFLWAKSASVLNRPLPPLPNLEVSEDCVEKVSDAAVVWINRVLAVAHDITLRRNVKLFLQVVFSLWLISYIGSIFSFLTLVYIVVLLSLTVPALYHKYQHHVDEKLNVTHKVILTQYRKIDDNILSKIPRPKNKEKKTQ